MRSRFGTARIWLPSLYLAIALAAWLDFLRLPPDGLANLGIILVVLPATVLDLLLTSLTDAGHSVLMPDRWGYYADQSVFFWASAAIIALGLYLLGGRIDRRRAA